jgi:hypothetical protein
MVKGNSCNLFQESYETPERTFGHIARFVNAAEGSMYSNCWISMDLRKCVYWTCMLHISWTLCTTTAFKNDFDKTKTRGLVVSLERCNNTLQWSQLYTEMWGGGTLYQKRTGWLAGWLTDWLTSVVKWLGLSPHCESAVKGSRIFQMYVTGLHSCVHELTVSNFITLVPHCLLGCDATTHAVS